MTQWMIDTFQVPDTSQWRTHDQEWGVRSITYHHRFGGWMGRLIDFHEVMAAILPELQTRWRRSLAQWTGEVSLTVDGQVCVLHIDGANIQYVLRPGAAAYHLELTPQALVQCIFGYRQLSSLTGISHLPDEARSALSILFPTDHTWLPASDWF